MRQFFFIIVLTSLFSNYTLAQGLTKNGKVTTTGTEYMNNNGAIGSTTGVDKNGKIITSGPVLGDAYQGGKIFYFFVDGDLGYIAGETHGLIASTSNVSGSRVAWGCGDYNGDGIADVFITGTQNMIGYGNANTIAIMADCSTAGIAARLCGDLTLNTYSDWYLPSFDELNKLYQNRGYVGGFNTDMPYWSSSQGGADQYYARGKWFSNGNSGSYNRTNPYWVRAIRSF